MTNYAFIACVKTKTEHQSRALQLYTSPLFRKSLLHALRARCRPYVLSAEYGLVSPDQILPPYEKTLNNMRSVEVKEWAKRTGDQLRRLLSFGDTVSIYAGKAYTDPLLPTLRRIGCRIQIPIEGALGMRLSLLKRLNDEEQLHKYAQEYYKYTRVLDAKEDQGMLVGTLRERKVHLPTRGLYQFIDPSENSLESSLGRVTRIGTHAVSAGAKSTLKGRINTHQGPKSGIGSHRSSIFRLHVGNAIMRRTPQKWNVPTWSEGMTAAASVRKKEAKLEIEVSAYINNHRVYWLDIPDNPGPASDRAFLERNIIGLLSSINVLRRTHTPNWLGEMSADYRIALSGLWNLDYLFQKPHDDFIGVYKYYVEAYKNNKPIPEKGIAPCGWRQQMMPQTSNRQLDLF